MISNGSFVLGIADMKDIQSEIVPAMQRIILCIPQINIATSITDPCERALFDSSLWTSPALAAMIGKRISIPKALGTLELLKIDIQYLQYLKDLLDEVLSLEGL